MPTVENICKYSIPMHIYPDTIQTIVQEKGEDTKSVETIQYARAYVQRQNRTKSKQNFNKNAKKKVQEDETASI